MIGSEIPIRFMVTNSALIKKEPFMVIFIQATTFSDILASTHQMLMFVFLIAAYAERC